MHETWRAIRLLIGTSARAEPWRSVAAVGLDILGILALPLTTIGLKYLTDGIVGADAAAVVAGVALVAGVQCVSRLADSIGFYLRSGLTERVGFEFDREITAMSATIPGIEHHERADYQDKLELVRRGQPLLASSLAELMMVVTEITGGIGVILVLAWLDPMLVLVALFALPAILLAARRERWYADGEEQSATPSRLARHLRELLRDRDAGMEVRVFGLRDELRTRMRAAALDARRPLLRAARKVAIVDAALQTFLVIGYVVAIGFMLWRAANGLASIGDVVAAAYISRQVAEMIVAPVFEVAMLGGTLRAAGRLLWLRDYAASARLTGDQPPPARLTDGITFDHVSFTYPGTERTVLHDVSLTIPAGTVLALVGENGAGKTTLVKLLTRMYEPTRGRILVDGVALADLDVEQWRQRTTAAFQDFATPELTAQRAVGTGDLARLDDAPAAMAALDRAGAANVAGDLPQGLATQLGSGWDGGVDLSTGQWQKLALGRAMMRADPLLVVLDEPTASLDAPTEHALFARYSEAARAGSRTGAITVLVSHRFSTVRFADLIVVLAAGRIAEVGSHDRLMADGGRYAELYTLQASSYA